VFVNEIGRHRFSAGFYLPSARNTKKKSRSEARKT
jgi:hypothetical protein